MLRYQIGAMAERRAGTRAVLAPIAGSIGAEKQYLRELRKMLRELNKVVAVDIVPVAVREAEERRLRFKDADEGLFESIKALGRALANIASQTVNNILGLEAQKHTKNFMQTAKSTLGIDLSSVVRSEDLSEYLDQAAVRNASLIKGLAEDVVTRVATTVQRAVINGTLAGDLKKELAAQFGFSDRRAKVIARDQIAKLTSDMNRIRHEQAGIERYVWRTSHDERVRPLHKKLDMNEYAYGEPTGAEQGLPPGQPIMCRCVAQAVVEFGGIRAEALPKNGEPLPESVVPKAPAARALKQAIPPAAPRVAPSVTTPVTASKNKLGAANPLKVKPAKPPKLGKVLAPSLQNQLAKYGVGPFNPETGKYFTTKQAVEILHAKQFPNAAKAAAPAAPAPVVAPAARTAPASTVPVINGQPTPTKGQKRALDYYVGSGYRELNENLRAGRPHAKAKHAEVTEDLDELIANSSLTNEGLLFRGIRSRELAMDLGVNRESYIGRVIEDKSFVSFSKVEEVSRRFAGIDPTTPLLNNLGPPGKILFRFKHKAGQRGFDVENLGDPDHPSESEIIMPRGTKYKITAVQRDKDSNAWFVDGEFVNE